MYGKYDGGENEIRHFIGNALKEDLNLGLYERKVMNMQIHELTGSGSACHLNVDKTHTHTNTFIYKRILYNQLYINSGILLA